MAETVTQLAERAVSRGDEIEPLTDRTAQRDQARTDLITLGIAGLHDVALLHQRLQMPPDPALGGAQRGGKRGHAHRPALLRKALQNVQGENDGLNTLAPGSLDAWHGDTPSAAHRRRRRLDTAPRRHQFIAYNNIR